MIGRDSELSTLTRLARDPGTALISGEAGIGKTCLLDAALSASFPEARVLRVRCHEEENAPFGALLNAIRVASPSSSLSRSGLGPEGIIDAVVAAAESRARSSTSGGEVPTALVMEDLHWAAPDTLDLLPRIEERLHSAGFTFIGTYRSDGLARRHRMRWVRSELRRTGRLVEIVLSPLDPELTALLVREVLPTSATTATLIHERSRGVPFYARELAAALARRDERALHSGDAGDGTDGDLPLPETVRDAIAARLHRLPAKTQRSVFVAALLGEVVDLDTYLDVGGDPEALLESAFVEEKPERGFQFTHGLVRDALRAEIPWREARLLHGEIAQALEKRGAHPRSVADHWLAAGEREKSRQALRAAVGAYEAAGARRDAARAARDALDLWPPGGESSRVELLLHLASLEQSIGELDGAVRAYHEASDHPVVRQDLRRTAEVNRSLATIMSLLGREQEAFRARRRSEAAFRELGEGADVAVELLQQLPGYLAGLRLSDAVQAAHEAAALAAGSGRRDLQARAMGLEGHLLAMSGRIDEGRTAAEAAFELAVKNELTAVSAEAYRRLGGVLEYSSDLAAATDVYENAVSQCRRYGAEDLACDAMGCMCYVVYRTGDYTRSLEIANEILHSRVSPPIAQATALLNIASIRTMRGEMKGARRAILRAEEFSRERGYEYYLHILRIPRAALLWADRSDDAAIDEYRGLLDSVDVMEDRHALLPGLCHAAGFFADRGDEEALMRSVGRLTELEETTGDPETAATLTHTLGALARLADDPETALSRFAEAASRFSQIGVPIEAAHAELQAGIAATAMGDTDAATHHVGRAQAIGRRLGARQLLTVVSRRIGKADLRTANPADDAEVTPTELLSPRQLEVAAHLIEGLTNKEIAGRLFVSSRTVEMHVAHIMDRLNCRSRTEAATRLKSMGVGSA